MAFSRFSPLAPVSISSAAAINVETPANVIATVKFFCGPKLHPVISGAATPASCESVFKYPIVRPTKSPGGACCEIVQKLELAMPNEQIETTRTGNTAPDPGKKLSRRIALEPINPAQANRSRIPNTLPVAFASRSAHQPAKIFTPAIKNIGAEKIAPICIMENPRVIDRYAGIHVKTKYQ